MLSPPLASRPVMSLRGGKKSYRRRRQGGKGKEEGGTYFLIRFKKVKFELKFYIKERCLSLLLSLLLRRKRTRAHRLGVGKVQSRRG